MKSNWYTTVLLWSGIMLLLAACSSKIPPEIRQQLAKSPSVSEVQEQPETYLSHSVIWGGSILNTENRQGSSWLTIMDQPLNKQGKPVEPDNSTGRFIAVVDKFMEPLVYSKERKITVTGKIVRSESRKVGGFMYVYPVVEVENLYLWAEPVEPVYIDYSPYWHYDPWFYPELYPWPYPYRLNHYHR